MSLTKAQLRTDVQQMFDDPNAALWTATNLDSLIGRTYDRLWTKILNNAPYYVSQLDTLTTLTSPGYFDVRLVADGGSLSKRFHRLQAIVRDSQVYSQSDQREVLIQANAEVVTPTFKYAYLGDQIWLFPFDIDADVEVRYSYKPTAFTSLAEGTAISWPDGHESALVFECAGRAMLKGDRENPSNLLTIAAADIEDMIQTVRKRSYFMSAMWTSSTPEEWGS